jgi:hypothetical protein
MIHKAITVAVLTVCVVASQLSIASAAGPVTQMGAEYSGAANPGECEIIPEGTDLHVKCQATVGATGEARIRFRFLSDVGFVQDPATISWDIGDRQGCATVEWMGPIRTLRVTVPFGCYIHIRSVTAEQP